MTFLHWFFQEFHQYQGQVIQYVSNYKYLKATAFLTNYSDKLENSIKTIEASRKRVGILNAIFDKWSMLIDHQATYKDKSGRWNLIMLEANNRRIMILVFYRIPDGSNHGIHTVKA